MLDFFNITVWTFVHKVMLLIAAYMILNLKVPDDISQYDLHENLGKGTFGTVISCTKNGKEFAIKIQEKDDNDFLEGEVRVLQAIQGNCHCVEMVSTFDDEKFYYIVFEKLYKSVYEIMVEEDLRILDLKMDLKTVTKQTLEAIAFLHSKNIIHGDIKPENIMFVKRGEPHIKLIDFGLSTFDDSTEKTNTISTTPYRCPESILSLPWSFGADIWSLGCVMCEMKTGQLLFDSGDHSEECPNDDLKQRHLSLIEKSCGPFTKQMVRKCSKFFLGNGRCDSSFMSNESKEILKCQPLIGEIFHDDNLAASLVTKMLVIDPHRRVSAAGALIHKFFA